MLAWWHLVWAIPSNLRDLLAWWDSQYMFKNLEKICWQATFYSVMWTLWICRNDKGFNNKVWEVEDICDVAKTRLALWIKAKYNIKVYSIGDFKTIWMQLEKCCSPYSPCMSEGFGLVLLGLGLKDFLGLGCVFLSF